MLPDYCINTYQLECIWKLFRLVIFPILFSSNFKFRGTFVSSSSRLWKTLQKKKNSLFLIFRPTNNLYLISPAIFIQHLIRLTIFSRSISIEYFYSYSFRAKRIFRTVIYIRRMHTWNASVQQLHLIPIMVVVKSINQHSSANEFPSAFFRGEPNGSGERNRIIFAKYTAVDPPTSTGMSYTRGGTPAWTTLSIKEYFVNVPSTDTYPKPCFAYITSQSL